MTVLTRANAFPNLPFPQHGTGQTATVTTFNYPGAVWVKSTKPAVLSYTNAFPNWAFPQHTTGNTNTVQSFLFPGAVQPALPTATLLMHTIGAYFSRKVTVVGY
jgi:hypothetical protein